MEKVIHEVDSALYEAALFCESRNHGNNNNEIGIAEETRSVEEIQNDVSRNEHEKWKKIVNKTLQ